MNITRRKVGHVVPATLADLDENEHLLASVAERGRHWQFLDHLEDPLDKMRNIGRARMRVRRRLGVCVNEDAQLKRKVEFGSGHCELVLALARARASSRQVV